MPLNVVFEGQSDIHVLRSILTTVGIQDYRERDFGGKSNILKNLDKYNQAAAYTSPWLIIVDMDQDADCVKDYVANLLPNLHPNLLLRIPVRAVESWIMADREHFARFINISVSNIPQNPDEETDPKQTLLNLVRRSRKTSLKNEMLPRPRSGAKIGIGYVNQIRDFVNHPEYPWRPHIAAENSESLARCIRALNNLSG